MPLTLTCCACPRTLILTRATLGPFDVDAVSAVPVESKYENNSPLVPGAALE